MSFGKSFSRLNGQPLDKSSIWYNLNEAKAYAATGAAYIGQQLAVINIVGEGDEATTTVDCYVIKDEAGNLTQLSASEIGEELAGAIADLQDKIAGLELYALDKYDSNSNTVEITLASLDEDGELIPGSLDVKIADNNGNLVKQGVIETDLGGDTGTQNVPGGLFVDPEDIKDIVETYAEKSNTIQIVENTEDGSTSKDFEVKLATEADETNLINSTDSGLTVRQRDIENIANTQIETAELATNTALTEAKEEL
jgi:hypothetical protein